MTNQYEAKFVTSAGAQDFYSAKCATPEQRAGNYITRAQIKGRTVWFWSEREPYPAGVTYYETYFYSLLEQIGYYGNEKGRKATLSVNGGQPSKAPMSY